MAIAQSKMDEIRWRGGTLSLVSLCVAIRRHKAKKHAYVRIDPISLGNFLTSPLKGLRDVTTATPLLNLLAAERTHALEPAVMSADASQPIKQEALPSSVGGSSDALLTPVDQSVQPSDVIRSQLDALERASEAKDALIRELQAEVRGLTAANTAVQGQVAVVTVDRDRLQAESRAARDNTTQLQHTITDLHDDIARLETTNRGLQAALREDVEPTIAAHSDRLAALATELDELKAKHNAFGVDIYVQRRRLDRLSSLLENLRAMLDDLRYQSRPAKRCRC